jgi:hypothetical protein
VLLPAPATVQIVAPWVNDPGLLLTSIDGGASFGVALLGELHNVEEALIGPAGSISLASDTPATYARYGVDGSGPAEWPVRFSDATEGLYAALALVDGRPVVFFAGDAGMKSYRWNGAGDPNDQATWVPGPAMGYGRWYPSAASGPSGTFLAYTDRARKRQGVFVRRVRGNRFGRPRRVTTSDPIAPKLVQWPDGALTVVYDEGSRTLARDSRNGRRWSRPRKLFSGNEPSGLQVAAGPKGGWIVWDGDPGLSDDEPIRIVRLRRPR